MARFSNKQKAAIGIGVAAAAAAAVGAYLLTGERGKKNRKKIADKYARLKADVERQVKRIRNLDKPTYDAIVSEVAKAYRKVSSVNAKELGRVVDELRAHWKEIGGRAGGKKSRPGKKRE